MFKSESVLLLQTLNFSVLSVDTFETRKMKCDIGQLFI